MQIKSSIQALVGPRVKTHKLIGNERGGDIDRKDYVILSRTEDDRFPPRTLTMDVTVTHDRYGRTTQRTHGKLTVSFTGAPQFDGSLNNAPRIKITNYCQVYTYRSDPSVSLSVAVSTSVRIYDDLVRLFFLHAHRESSILARELPRNLSSFVFCELYARRILSTQ
jgi:hypothetical protein